MKLQDDANVLEGQMFEVRKELSVQSAVTKRLQEEWQAQSESYARQLEQKNALEAELRNKIEQVHNIGCNILCATSVVASLLQHCTTDSRCVHVEWPCCQHCKRKRATCT